MQGCTSLHACAHAESSGEHSAYTFYSEARVNSAAADFAAMLLNHGADPALKNQQASTYCCSTCSLCLICMKLQECTGSHVKTDVYLPVYTAHTVQVPDGPHLVWVHRQVVKLTASRSGMLAHCLHVYTHEVGILDCFTMDALCRGRLWQTWQKPMATRQSYKYYETS